MLTIDEIQRLVMEAIPAELLNSSVGYIDLRPYEEGDVLLIHGAEKTAPAKLILGFVDLNAGRNWGHPCIYLAIELESGQASKLSSNFPPPMGDDRQWRVLFVGNEVPAYAVMGRERDSGFSLGG